MNLFFARLFGKLMTAEKAEKYNEQLIENAKRYRKIEASEEYKEYLQLKDEVGSASFAAKKQDFLSTKEGKKTWPATDEAKKEARLAALTKSADILFIEKADLREVEDTESWQLTFTADFSNATLAKNGFKPGFWFKNPQLKSDFSYIEEAQAYVGEKNVETSHGLLSIITKREEVSAPAWDGKKGFVMHDFHYSSAVINTGDQFSQPIGKFVAKVRATGKCHSAIYLVGANRFPVIELFHFNGKHLTLGFTDKNGAERIDVKGIKASDWNLLTCAVNRQEIVWSINNREVFRTKNPLPGQELYFSCQSFAPAQKGAEGRLDIDYIKAYNR